MCAGNAVEWFDFAIYPLAALSDRIGRTPMLIAGSVAFAIFGHPLFLLLNSGSLVAAIAAHYVVTWLTAETGNNVAPAFYLIVAAVVSLGAVLTLKETASRPLPQTSDQQLAAAIQ